MFNLTFLCSVLCLTITLVETVDESILFRLPTNIIPLRYDIDLKSDIHKFDLSFNGHVIIIFQVMNSTNEIVIHQRQLNIHTNTMLLFQVNENFEITKNINIKNTSYVSSNNFFTIETNLNDVLVKGSKYFILITYDGVLNTKPIGFYVVSHLNENNQTILSAMTQFKPNYARQMFPCFDEPQLKANFNLKIIHGNNITAISNMPGQITISSNDLLLTEFPETPQMSTYSFSLILSNLTNISTDEDSNRIVHQVYSTFEKNDQLALLPQISLKILPTLVSTLAVKYSLPQLAQIVVDSSANTSNNWGVITYSDSSIYFDLTDYFYRQEENIIRQITHEIASQFFGHIVSPFWWNSLWLTDGLIIVTANIVLNIEYPNYRVVDDFLINIKQNTLMIDTNGDIPLLEYDVMSFAQITEIFSGSTRNKAACIIYMMMHAIGEEVFHMGLKQYLVQKENSTIRAIEFFELLDTLARSYGTLSTITSIPNIVKTWSSQKSVPILTVHRNYSSGLITVTQTSTNSSDSVEVWWAIPYNFIVKREAELDVWLTNSQGWFDLPTHSIVIEPTAYRDWSSTDWILFNKKATGYYRINYDRNNWDLLIADLSDSRSFSLIHYLNRAQLIDDSFNFAKENVLSYDIPLNIATFLQYDNEHFVWQSFYDAYQFLERILFETDDYGEFSSYIKNLAGKLYDNFERKSYYDLFTQKILINLLCRARYYNCIQDSVKVVVEFLNNPVVLTQYLDEEYLHNGIRFIDANSVSILLTTAMATADTDLRLLIFSGIGFTTNSESIELLVNTIITDNNQNIGDTSITVNLTNSERKIILLSIINNNPAGFKILLNSLRTEREDYRRIMFNEIPDILKSVSHRISTIDSYNRFQTLIDVYKNLQNQATLNSYLENAKANVNWLDNRLDEIRTNLQNINDNSNAISMFVPMILIFITQAILIY